MKTALLIEGLFSYSAGFVRNTYSDALKDKGYKVTSIPWTSASQYKDIYYDLIIAHSFGAGYAIKNEMKTNQLITMDARAWDFWNNNKFEGYGLALGKHVNFYQRSPLRGYTVKGVYNIDMGLAGHTRLPKACFDKVMEVL